MTGTQQSPVGALSPSGAAPQPAKEAPRAGRAVGEPSVLASPPSEASLASGTRSVRDMSLGGGISAVRSSPAAGGVDASEVQRQQRLTAMCDNHAMFQFLFDREGRLLAANQRALQNMRGKNTA